MESVAEPLAESISRTLRTATSELEKMWSNMVEISGLAEPDDKGSSSISSLALRRLISYNPNARTIDSASKLRPAVDAVNQIIVRKASELNSEKTSHQALIALAHCYLVLSDFPNAYAAYTNALKAVANIQDPFFWYGIGCVYHNFKYYKSAQEFFKKALSGVWEPALAADIKMRLAMVERELQNFPAAFQCFDEVKNQPPADLIQDDVLFHIAFTNQMADRNAEAADIYAKLYDRHRDSIELKQQYCWFLSVQDDNRSWNTATEIINSSAPDPTLKLVSARLALKQCDMTGAHDRYTDCIKYWNDSPLFWCGLGILYFKNDQQQDAEVAFQRALFFKPESEEVWFNLGRIKEKQDPQGDNALKIYQTGFQYCPGSTRLKERINALQSGHRMNICDLVEMNESKFFTQAVQRISEEYAATPPRFPAAQLLVGDKFMDEQQLDELLSELIAHHRSCF